MVANDDDRKFIIDSDHSFENMEQKMKIGKT